MHDVCSCFVLLHVSQDWKRRTSVRQKSGLLHIQIIIGVGLGQYFVGGI